MPSNEVKQRKKTQTQNDESSETNKREDKIEKVNAKDSDERKSSWVDLRTTICLLSLLVCLLLTRVVLQQNEKLTEVEEKYEVLSAKTASLFEIEEDVLKVSKKLSASEDDLRGALSAASLATQLQQDVASLYAAVAATQADDTSASRHLQAVNSRFLNVTETWQERLSTVAADLARLQTETRAVHGGATDRFNEAERRARSLAERLEELEDSSARNARALQRSEEEDAKRAAAQLDWNTQQVAILKERVAALGHADVELGERLQEHLPRARQCEEQLPAVEEAVRSILRLGGDLGAAERRLEELTLQVFGTEDSMLKALTEIVDIRQDLDALQADRSLLRMKYELGSVTEAVRELRMLVAAMGVVGAGDSGSVVEVEEEVLEKEEEDQEEEEVMEEEQEEEEVVEELKVDVEQVENLQDNQ